MKKRKNILPSVFSSLKADNTLENVEHGFKSGLEVSLQSHDTETRLKDKGIILYVEKADSAKGRDIITIKITKSKEPKVIGESLEFGQFGKCWKYLFDDPLSGRRVYADSHPGYIIKPA